MSKVYFMNNNLKKCNEWDYLSIHRILSFKWNTAEFSKQAVKHLKKLQ